uniref:Tudor domain-containing protein n=1 Tax=Pelagomonas calceolata TaxID=35677 RepID=A0A7S3ZUX3_9STRA|mmetsp:Transcript_25747/g.72389  ORF Transcript_25747/g.72389 Transcript_25747/m.72389 type:complete len:888 (+) Transcript_25747:263-2926(+)
MNQVLNECHAARTARREDGYARPRLLSQFRGELEENGEDGLGLPRRPTEAELDALEAKYRTEMPQVVSEPLGLPMESSAWQLADGTVVSDVDPYADWEARARGEGVEALAAARAARAAAEEDAPLSPAGSLPSPVGRPDSDLGRAIDAAIRDADEALAAIGADADSADAAELLPGSSETDNASDGSDDAVTAEPTAEPAVEHTAEPKAEPTATSGAKADGAKYDGSKYDGAKADSYDGTDGGTEPIAVGDPVYGTLVKLLDAAQRGDHTAVAGLLREADPAARRRLAGSRARVGSSFTSSTPLELAAAAHEEGEEAAVECCALLLRYTCASKDAVASARRVGNDAVAALLETPIPPQDEDAPPPVPKAPLTVGAAHARGRLLGRKLFRAISTEGTATTDRLLGAVERAPTLVRRAAIAFTDGNRWTSLHAAAAVGNADAVSRLLTVGASPALRTATGADVVKIACDARQIQVVGVLRRHAAGATGKRRKPRPPPPPEEQVPEPTPTSEVPPPPPPAETAPTEAPPTPAAPPAPEPLFAVGARIEAQFEGGDEWYAGVVEAVDGDTFNVLYDDGDREIGIAAAFMRMEGSTESSADDAPATDALITDVAPVETAPAPPAEATPPKPPAETAPPPPPVETAPPRTKTATGRASASNLAKACRRGDAKAVENLLERGAPVGDTLLHEVCGLDDVDAAVSIARLIIAKDKTAAARLDRVGRPPLFGAVHCSALFDLIFEAWPAGATTTDTRGFTALHAAAAAGTDVVEFMVESGARIDARDDRGRVPLWHAAANGHVNVVKSLCSRTGRLSSAENPLEVAISRRHYDVARVLLDAGAPVSNRVVELARTGPLRNAVLARRKSDDERKRARVAPVVATKAELRDFSHRLVGV